MIRFLLPYFTVITPDLDLARAEILETLAAYGARTRSEMLNAVQIIAFGFAALEVLEEARTQDLSPSMRLRYHGCANNLNRSCQLNEKSLGKQLACELASPTHAPAEPVNNVPDAEAGQILHQARTRIETTRNVATPAPRAAPHAASAPQRAPSQQDVVQQQRHSPLTSAMMNALAGMGMPETPIPNHGAASPVPPGHVPPGRFPPGHVPPGHVPPGHVPPGHVPPGRTAMEPPRA